MGGNDIPTYVWLSVLASGSSLYCVKWIMFVFSFVNGSSLLCIWMHFHRTETIFLEGASF